MRWAAYCDLEIKDEVWAWDNQQQYIYLFMNLHAYADHKIYNEIRLDEIYIQQTAGLGISI